ncbi:hypothetical protein RCL1_002303 [Eukaryota sp. TZLM3-RCL]
MEDFEVYEKEYSTSTQTLSKLIVRLETEGPKGTVVADIQHQLDEANQTLQQMQVSCSGLAPRHQTTAQNRLRNYRAELTRLKQDFARAQDSANRGQLMSGAKMSSSGSNANRDRLLESQSSLDATDNHFKRANQYAAESLAIGTDVLSELRGQRETLNRASTRLKNTDQNVNRGRMYIRTMNRRVITNKLILSAIITLLVLLILFLIWNKFRS